ncbi:tRNA-dihydrouridine(47) synthase [NAD(P)(+)]-like protein [Halocaridina rubra]|uniref:tRNA-dihydrouridine(47) synthase [NAD(P)(+)] n=1 Tax=Halocaridina rubra TaxID=373956 RepID=A0AAN8WUB2_HALRR
MSNLDINDVVAHVKSEFVLPIEPVVPKPQPATESKSNEDKDATTEPPVKKQKLTGTNKNRPKLIKAPKSSKLCRSVWCLRIGEDSTKKCTYEKCDFSHDIVAYLASKPEDLGRECHNYRTFGMCHYGLTCRFGSDHIEGLGNRINEDLLSRYENNPSVFNTIKKEVQFELRKRKFDFSRALRIHRKIQSEIEINKRNSNTNEQNSCRKKESECKTETNGVAKQNCEDRVQNGVTSDVGPKNENEIESGTINDARREAIGPAADDDLIRLNGREKKKIIWKGKTYLAPLTTVGNLPFRRICKDFGADITCSEMALATNLLQGSPSEWALVRRHQSENLFGVQLCGSNAEAMIKCSQLLDQHTDIDFIDINMGCPIDLIFKQGGGSALMRRQTCLEHMVKGMTNVLSVPLTLKMRTAIYHDTHVAHNIITKAKLWDVSLITLHGRSKEQRYVKLADWKYINECAAVADPIPLFGNGDVLSYEDYDYHVDNSNVSGIMIGRGALIKPWVFKEIKEKKHWDISSSERFDMLKRYVQYGMEHWGSDTEGLEKTRRFLLEWLSFLHRYIPVGILDQTQRINQRPPLYKGRDDLETLMASRSVTDWVKISEMLLGPTPPEFNFLPKHKANAY